MPKRDKGEQTMIKKKTVKIVMFLILLLSLISVAYAPVQFTSDSDHDGVPDVVDNCKNTESNAAVDANGCSCEQKRCKDDNNPCTDLCGGSEATCNIPNSNSCGESVVCPNDNCVGNTLYDYPRTSSARCANGICVKKSCEPGIIKESEKCIEGEYKLTCESEITSWDNNECKCRSGYSEIKCETTGFWTWKRYKATCRRIYTTECSAEPRCFGDDKERRRELCEVSPEKEFCGNWVCETNETPLNCPNDCRDKCLRINNITTCQSSENCVWYYGCIGNEHNSLGKDGCAYNGTVSYTLCPEKSHCENGQCVPDNSPPLAVIWSPANNSFFNLSDVITFDGEFSYDPDGTIAIYDWHFGDGPTPMTQARLTLWLDKDGEEGHTVIHYFDPSTGGYTFASEVPLFMNNLNPGMYGVPESEYITNGTRDYHYLFAEDYDFHYEINPKHTYTDMGTYTVTLIVSDGLLNDTDGVIINVMEKVPQAELTVATLKDDYETGEQVNLTDPPVDSASPVALETTIDWELDWNCQDYFTVNTQSNSFNLKDSVDRYFDYIDMYIANGNNLSYRNLSDMHNLKWNVIISQSKDIMRNINSSKYLNNNYSSTLFDQFLCNFRKELFFSDNVTHLDDGKHARDFFGLVQQTVLTKLSDEYYTLKVVRKLLEANPDAVSKELLDNQIVEKIASVLDHQLEYQHEFRIINETYNWTYWNSYCEENRISSIELFPNMETRTYYFYVEGIDNLLRILSDLASSNNKEEIAQLYIQNKIFEKLYDIINLRSVWDSRVPAYRIRVITQTRKILTELYPFVSDEMYVQKIIEWSRVNQNKTSYFWTYLACPKHLSRSLDDMKAIANLSNGISKPKSQILNTGSIDITGYLFMEVQKSVNKTWQSHQVVVDETAPRTVEAESYLALDLIWNEQNVTINELGNYRVYAELKDENGQPIQTTTGFLNNSWEFDVTKPNHAPIAIIWEPENNSTFNLSDEIIFDGSKSHDPNGDKLIYIWDLGDLSFRFDTVFNYSYAEPGTYVITLVVSDGELNDTDSVVVNIAEEAKVQWIPAWCYETVDEDNNESENSTGGGGGGSDGDSLSVSKLQLLKQLGVTASQIGSFDVSGLDFKIRNNEFLVSSEFSEQHIQRTEVMAPKINLMNEKGESIELDISNLVKSSDENTKGYIVEFDEEPVLGFRKGLRKEIEDRQNEINSLKTEIKSTKGILNLPKKLSKNIKLNRLESGLESSLEDIPVKLFEQEIKITKQHEKLEKEFRKKIDNFEEKKLTQYKKVFNGIALDISREKVDELKKIKGVKNVHPNKEIRISLYESIRVINADDVWKELDFEGNNITGQGMTIAIIDTGIDYTHPDLGGCFGNDCKVIGGYDFINDDNDPMDDHGHGTHCAGIAAGNGILKGVAPDAKLYAYKVLSAGGSGSTEGVIAGIERAVDPNNDGDFSDHVDVISMSLGRSGGTPDDPDAKAVDNAVEAGVIVAVAAGNSGPGERTIGCPGCARKAITVGANDKCNLIAEFSSRGPVEWEDGSLIKPDVTAPGVDICAAQYDDAWEDYQCIDDEHTAISGTSMATPHVAGASALVKQAIPELTAEEVKSVLMLTSYDTGYNIFTQGSGRIDVKNALIAEIISDPVSFAFDTVSETHLEKDIVIKNLKDYDLELELDAGMLNDNLGNQYDVASISNSSLMLPANSNISVKVVIDLPQDIEGNFLGKLTISTEQNEYSLKYMVTKLSKLTVTVSAGDREIEPSIYLHDQQEISSEKPFMRRSYTDVGVFRVPSGNYTVYATGDTLNWSFEYLIMDNVNVPLGSETEKHLNIHDARPFTIKAHSLDGRNLKLEEWQKGFVTYNNMTSFSVNYHDPTYGDRTVYVSNKPDNKFDTDIIFKYFGVPVNED